MYMSATKNGANIVNSFIIPPKLRHSDQQKPFFVSKGFHDVIRSICSNYLTFLRPESLFWNARAPSLFSFLIPKFNDVMITLFLE